MKDIIYDIKRFFYYIRIFPSTIKYKICSKVFKEEYDLDFYSFDSYLEHCSGAKEKLEKEIYDFHNEHCIGSFEV